MYRIVGSIYNIHIGRPDGLLSGSFSSSPVVVNMSRFAYSATSLNLKYLVGFGHV